MVGAAVGLGVVVTPFLETLVLTRTNKARSAYLVLSSCAMVQTLYHLLVTPETLPLAKRVVFGAKDYLSAMNPLAFVRIYTHGSAALQKLVTIISLQFYLEGKNWSDFIEIWKREHLGWDVVGSRNFVVAYGVLCIIAGTKLTPALLNGLSAKGFSSLTNVTNALGFVLRGATENPWVFIAAVPFMLPGVNGASSTALRAVAQDCATAEGFGKGEFAAYQNNLRAITSAIAPMLIGNYYAWCLKRGVKPGSNFWLGALIGAILPELLMRLTMSDSEFKAPPKVTGAPAKAAA